MKRNDSYLVAAFVVFLSGVSLTACGTAGKTVKGVEPSAPNAATEATPPVPEVRLTEFILGPGDKIHVTVYRNDDLTRDFQIDPSGMISYPLVGDINVGGSSIFRVRDTIRAGLSKYIVDPQVSVAVTAVQSQKVTVLGEVKNPGLFNLESPLTIVEAVSKAGGFTVDAKKKNVLVVRGGTQGTELTVLDIDSFFDMKDASQNISVRNGDIVYVPTVTIANVSRFFDHLNKIITPLVLGETGYFIGQQIERHGTATIVVPAR